MTASSLDDLAHVRRIEELTAELSKAHTDRDDSLRREVATAEILRVISQSKADAQPVFDTIVRSALRLCNGLFSSLFQFDGNLLHPVAHHNYTPEALEQLHRAYPRPPDRGGGTGRAILDRAVVQILDVELDPDYQQQALSRAIGWRSGLFVPMLRDGTPIGVIMVARAAPGLFPDNEVELLKTFADQAVIAIENTRLFEAEQARTLELKESLEYQTATADVLNVISRSPNELRPVLNAIVATAGRLCEADYAHCRLERDGHYHVMARHALNPAEVESVPGMPVVADRTSVTSKVVSECRTIHVPDVLADPEDTYAVNVGVPARTILGVPLVRSGKAIGVIVLFRRTVRPFSQRQIDLVTTFASQALIAIENTRLFEAEQASKHELQESLEYQTAISDVLGVISRSPSQIEPVMQTIANTARKLCRSERAIVWRIEKEAFRPIAFSGVDVERIEQVLQYRLPLGSGSTLGRAALAGHAVQVLDPTRDPGLGPANVALALSGNVRTVFAVPLLREGNAIGGITLSRTIAAPFTDRQIALVETFADQAVIAIENARLFEAEQASKRELQQSLDRQTATSEVLRVISSSPGELGPVFQAMLENAVRICDAKFGNLWLREGSGFRIASTYGASAEYREFFQREPVVEPHPESGLGLILRTKQAIHRTSLRPASRTRCAAPQSSWRRLAASWASQC
jgi:GAF domain-containing protein